MKIFCAFLFLFSVQSFTKEIVLNAGESTLIGNTKISCANTVTDNRNNCAKFLDLSSSQIVSTLALGIGKCYARSKDFSVGYRCYVYDSSRTVVYATTDENGGCSMLGKLIKYEMKYGSFLAKCGCD